ncbi:2-dehydropantoate 2-reductase [Joostella atrarenae]|uniref:2-dehydropantoate 2-reductase n=1 Tax=Joostella atrarenae TaxID=679257 RepID=A0ABS9J6R2_9FLAO|nr:2-dehydropantoate 2-reductase [Joostella atrarenae]MCF8716131.1 2-dehydropantoate 2-reductase [Joostella atrarenae]
MNILIYGIGGVGGYFGGKLAATDHHISFYGRGSHLKAIQENGLQVKSFEGDFKVYPDIATNSLEDIPTPDLVLLGVKSWQLEEAALAINPFLKETTAVLPLQNGADNHGKLLKCLSEKQVLTGLCNLISYIESPGVICHFAIHPTLTFGEIDNNKSDRVNAINAVFNEAGIVSFIADDIHREIWKKFMFIATISAIGGLTRVPIGAIRSSPYLYKKMEEIANEILHVAQAKQINLTVKDVENVFKTIDKLDPQSTASTQRDIMEGKPSELENFNGYIVKEGARLNVATPVNEFIYECLKPMETKSRSK